MIVARQTPIYDNWSVFSQEGNLIFKSSAKRANWYISRGLAETIGAKSIRLLFKANGSGHANDTYYLSDLPNICVCCGAEKDLVRQHIVPSAYRRYMPDSVKNHSHHDILPMCLTCRKHWEARMAKIMKELAELYDVPPNGRYNVYDDLRVFAKAKSAAAALLKHKDKIPEKRREELLEQVALAAYYGGNLIYGENGRPYVDELTLKVQAAWQPPAPEPPGKLIVEKILAAAAGPQKLWPPESAVYRHLTSVWRASFVAFMGPKFLPENWSVTRTAR